MKTGNRVDRSLSNGRLRASNSIIAGALAVGIMFAGLASGCRKAAADLPVVSVYKTATCGCCSKWIEHLKAAGFEVEATDLPDLAKLKAESGVPRTLESCHTAKVEGYVIEGHVPAEDIVRLLAERPAVRGLAVPEMPLGSPGMEHPDPSRHQAYQVMSFGADGAKVYASHAPR